MILLLVILKQMINSKKKEVDKFSTALSELEQILDQSIDRQKVIKSIANKIRENEVHIAKENSSISQLEKFNATLQSEVKHLEEGHIDKKDHTEVKDLKEEFKVFNNEKDKLREEKVYSEAVRTMLTDQGIKTKIIKQYLPIINKFYGESGIVNIQNKESGRKTQLSRNTVASSLPDGTIDIRKLSTI